MAMNISTHRNIMLQILKDIYSDTTISPFLGFKGGTAAYMFYDLSRFSVDLDFDLLDKTKEDYVFEKVRRIMRNYGNLKEAKKKAKKNTPMAPNGPSTNTNKQARSASASPSPDFLHQRLYEKSRLQQKTCSSATNQFEIFPTYHAHHVPASTIVTTATIPTVYNIGDETNSSFLLES